MKSFMVLIVVTVLTAGMAQAVTIDLVPVGNINNAADTTGYGSVDHAYAIGKYEVTTGQYTEFLNAKAKTDPYGLYNTRMSEIFSFRGCNIQRSGSSGDYTYSVDTDYANRPVDYVSFWDAARFTNWLSNGQGTGGDTETGAYTLGGYNGSDGHLIVKNASAQWWIPSENEWYKAAYHKNDGVTGNYFLYPSGSNTAPGQDLADLSGNNANYYTTPYVWPIDSGKYTTLVGEFQNSASPYGTFDQAGNVWEWNDTVIGSSFHCLRGGSFDDNSSALASSIRNSYSPMDESSNMGFRVASVPEPGSLLMTAIALGGLMSWRRRKTF